MENHYQIIQIIQKINHLVTLIIEADSQNKKIHKISHKKDMADQIVETISIETTIHDQIQLNKNRFLLVPIQNLGIDTILMKDPEYHLTIDTGNFPTIGIEVTQILEINDTKTIDREIIQTTDPIIKDLTNNNYQNGSRDNSQNRISNYNNRQRNYSQSSHRNNNRYPDSQNKYRSNAPKHQRKINQEQTTEETNSDPLVSIA